MTELVLNEARTGRVDRHAAEQFLTHGKLEAVMAERGTETPSPVMMEAVRALLEGIGEDPAREGLVDTPKRVARMLREVTSGYGVDLDAIINGAIFDEEHGSPVVVRDIEFHSMCEHHMLPFNGRAHVAYVPQGKIVGLSKIARIVETFSRRLQVQERLTDQVADFIDERLAPAGVAVVVEGSHMCAVMRGVRQQGGTMRTEALRGVFAEDPGLAARLLP